ncbi:hypothetical protein B0T18DRAFT_428312 [Schizothecium vesticola]|uniref:Cytochrome b5 heme-binding domain-containing protein n=1 Tax=Schizothecium vesticola TaxID=314040 RepID=A0AA40F384_9PEZI|nr:hypothetical protein B0T18DRAFT_428312 [Schizothecium vesticola]
MALIGVSLIVASVVLFYLRQPAWLPSFFQSLQPPPPRLLPGGARDSPPPTDNIELQDLLPSPEPINPQSLRRSPPKRPHTFPLPRGTTTTTNIRPHAPPPRPAIPRLQPQPYARAAGSSTLPRTGGLLPNRPGGPLPNRGGLAPPPTHTTKPAKPSKEVALAPGHSPLDWARLSSSPHADLAGVGGSYLRVTPSLLKKMTGRRGKDAWTVLGGRVYNITPYLPFHPGGEPELLRGAGRDGTKMFGEVHPDLVGVTSLEIME